MPNAEYVHAMARYNLWQNNNLVSAATRIGPAARQRDRGAFFGSIEKTFFHVCWADRIWMSRFTELYERLVWINPTPQETWEYSSSVSMIQGLVEGKMYPLTIRGLEEGMTALSK